MNLLHSVESLSRQAGGLPVAVMNLASALAGAGSEVKCSLLAPPMVSGDAVSVDGSERVRILDGDLEGRRRLTQWHADEPFQVIHQHGIWAPLPVATGRFARRKGVPLMISPHGMLEPWALGHHAFRKRLAWLAYQSRNLKSAAVLHATSDAEASQFRHLGFTQPIAVLPLGVAPIPAVPLDPVAADAPKPRRQVLFLSRIHPKKGIDLLLKAWSTLDAPDWELVIAGIDADGHEAALVALAKRLGLGDRVRFAGPLYGAAKDTAFRRADLLVLPSHSENFGFVVAEALQYGLPVITTLATPWRHIPGEGCGWCVAPESSAIGDALRDAIALSDQERRAMGSRGIDLVRRDHHWPEIAIRFLSLYRWLAESGPRPDCLDERCPRGGVSRPGWHR
jgi:glycosyltransferase involved in cell wall biosynthesis